MLYDISWQQFENLLKDWCYDSGELKIYHLQNFIQYLPKLIEQNRADGRRAIRRAMREWVREGGKGELHSHSNS
ncbi:MAG: hypothetical protein RMY29_007835 [Nostoc sp. CreGUA01]|nr:hypothetical protein [Nostoc sp. CreGUA01]